MIRRLQICARGLNRVAPRWDSRRIHAAVSYLAISERDTEDLACLYAESREVGDTILLRGKVGAGKSAFRFAFPH
jgi:hypothetical protein